MAKRTRRVRILRAAAIVVAVVLALVAAFPVWFPWVLGPAARSFGAHYSEFQRHGYARFSLAQATFTNEAVTLKADRVEALVPTVWLWNRYVSRDSRAFLNVHTWELRTHPRDPNGPDPEPQSVYTNYQSIRSILDRIGVWLPNARFTNGTVHLPGRAVSVPMAAWSDDVLTARIAVANGQSMEIRADTALRDFDARASKFGERTELRVRVESAAQELELNLELAELEDGLGVAGMGKWMTNEVQLEAEFGREGRLPRTASARAPEFTVPGALLRLEDYENPRGALLAEWMGDRFTVQVDAAAEPQTEDLPRLVVEAHAFGTTEFAQVDLLNVSTPWFRAQLNEPARVQYTPPFVTEPTTLELSANLNEQTFVEAQGHVFGTATLLPTYERIPRVPFSVSGSNVMVAGVATETLALEGELRWPDVRIERGDVVLTEGGRARIAGGFNARSRVVSGGRFSFEGVFGQNFLPEGYAYDHATVEARLEGALTALSHEAAVSISGARTPGFRPLTISAEWTGQQLNVQRLEAIASSELGALQFRGAARLNPSDAELVFDSLTLSSNEVPQLALQQPARIRFQARTNNAAERAWAFQVQSFRWRGSGGNIDLETSIDWPRQGEFEIGLSGLNSGLARIFLTNALPEAAINQLAAHGGWTNGPIHFQVAADASVVTDEQVPFKLTARAAGDAAAVSLGEILVTSATQNVVSASGTLPIRLEASTNLFRSDPEGRLQVRAATAENSLLWENISRWTGLRLDRPSLHVQLDGTWSAPQGTIAADINRVEFTGEHGEWPPVHQIRLRADLDRERARISQLRAFVEGQPVIVTAELPLGEGVWEDAIRHRRLPDWRRATARLRIEDAQIGPFAQFAPDLITPQGVLDVEVTVAPGGNINGILTLTNARTRPLESIGPVRDIAVTAMFSNGVARLESLSANVGGQTVLATGRADFRERFRGGEQLPPFEVRLVGTNVPLARRADMVVRADLNLNVTNSGAAPAMVSGRVRLRDSFFLSDLRDLVPGGTVASPRRRPPYFSVEAEPWADWRLNLAVEGDRFLRIRSPIFRGVASTTLRVEGTLRNPMALGEARINSGRITFPFGSLDVQQGFVTLTSDDPYRPRLLVNAEAQRLGYDIKMEATGPADQPVVTFSSTPPLSSEQIVMMLTTGQVPQGMAGTSTQRRAQGLALFIGRNLLTEMGMAEGDEERLTVRSGEHLTEAGKPTYDIEYRLSDRWSLLGEYDRFGQYNLGLKWRVYSK